MSKFGSRNVKYGCETYVKATYCKRSKHILFRNIELNELENFKLSNLKFKKRFSVPFYLIFLYGNLGKPGVTSSQRTVKPEDRCCTCLRNGNGVRV